MLPLALLSIAAYLGARFDRRWIPHDEGLLAQTAERVLQGQWPHRDFDDPYTGGLTLLHAVAMRALGVRLVSMRWLLLAAAVAVSVVLYRIARRVAAPPLAALVTWLGVAWGMPNYFAGLPSWYNLMLAACGTLFLMRFIERERRFDLVLAGVLGGLSFLVKAVGLYYVAAGLLTLVFMTALDSERPEVACGSRFQGWLVRAGLATFGALLVCVVDLHASLMTRVHFTLPGLVLLGVIFVYDVRLARRGRWLPVRPLLDRCLTFLAGVALPVAVFLVPYVVSHSLDAFAYGVFIAPQRRIGSVTFSLPPLPSLLAGLPCFGLLASPLLARSVADRPRTWVLASTLALLLLCLGWQQFVYTTFWFSLRPLVPLSAIVCALQLTLPERARLSALQRAQLFASTAVCSFVSLVQFPYASGIYFFYVAPLLVLSLLFLITSQSRAPLGTWLVVGAFHLGFALLWLNTGHVRALGVAYVPDRSDVELSLPRAGLKVASTWADMYERLIREVHAHAPPSTYIYAAPDCPEVYFLANRMNPTRTFYDLFDRDFLAAPGVRSRRILDALERHHVDVVVIRLRAEFSGRFDSVLMQALTERYPHSTPIAPRFHVRYRDPQRLASRDGYDIWH
jgi:hypothetical protein